MRGGSTLSRQTHREAENSFRFEIQDYTPAPGETFVVDEARARILAREGASKCLHGRRLYYTPATSREIKRIPTRCSLCEFEIELLSRRPSDRSDHAE